MLAAAGAPAPAPFVYVKRGGAAFADDVFAQLPLAAGATTVADVAARACAAFPHWRAAADQVRLYPLPSAERARAAQRDAASADDVLGGEPLFAGDDVAPGTWLLARVPPPPPPSPPTPTDASVLLPVMLRALRLEAARPAVDVRLWARPGVYSAKLDDDFGAFRAGVAAAVRADLHAVRLYFFRGAERLADRIAIDSDAALRDFAASRAAVWVF